MDAPRLIKASEQKEMPWKNGSGTTTEIAISPPGADFSSGKFQWRVSSARLSEDGPFSRFPGYERLLCLIEGQALVLDHGAHAGQSVSERLVPLKFSGDWETSAELPAGPVRDFNVIYKRGYVHATLSAPSYEAGKAERLHVAEGTCLLYCAQGEFEMLVPGQAEPLSLAVGDALEFQGTLEVFAKTKARVIQVLITYLN